MKKSAMTIMVFVLTLLMLVVAPAKQAKAQFSASISFQTFYDELSPYGQWIDDPSYGYVWVPDVNPGFRPYYSSGHWVMTRHGAMWVSDYSWGWAPFHYGRWTYSSYYGWLWVPDTEWAPAWVSWRSGVGIYGWAPLGPGLNISLFFSNGYSVPYDWWTFVPDQYAFSPVFYNYRVAPTNNITYVSNTTIINNTHNYGGASYFAGPEVNDVQRATKGNVRVYDVASVNSRGKTSVQGNSVRTFIPKVSKTEPGNAKPTPKKAVSRDQFIKANPGKAQPTERTKPNQIERNNTAPKKESPAPKRVEQTNRTVPQKQNVPQTERKQTQPTKKVIQEMPRKTNQPAPVERRQVEPKKNNQPVMQERNQPAQMERRQNPPSNKPVMQQQRQQSQPAPQQKSQPAPQQQRPQQQKPQQQERTQPAGKKKNN